MQLKTLSPSSFNTYSFCEWKYFLNYSLGFPDPAGPSATLGSIVHNAFETLSELKIKGGEPTIESFDAAWDAALEKYAVAEKENFDAMKSLKQVRKACVDFLATPHSPINVNTLVIEQKFKLPMEKKGWEIGTKDGKPIYLNLTGRIDRVDRIDDNTIEIVDYKTGQRRDFNPSNRAKEKKGVEEMYNDIQLRMYHLAARQLYPEYKNVLVTLIFITDGGAFTIPFCDNDIPKTLSMLKTRFTAIRDNNSPERTVGWHCTKICSYGKNGLCQSIWEEKESYGIEFVQNQYQTINKPGEWLTKAK